MKKTMFKGEPNQRELLSDNAYEIEERSYLRQLSEEEIDEAKSDYIDASADMARLEKEFAEVKREWSGKLKEKKTWHKRLLDEIRYGAVEQKGRLYAFPDEESDMMEYYDATGEFVESRRLKPEERAGNVFSISHKSKKQA